MFKAVPHDKSSLASFLYALGGRSGIGIRPQKHIGYGYPVPLIILRTRNPERGNKLMGWMVVCFGFAWQGGIPVEWALSDATHYFGSLAATAVFQFHG